MKIHRLPLSREMVLARRTGRKTQTRRVVVPQPPWTINGYEGESRFHVGNTILFTEAFRISESVGGRTVKVHYHADCSIKDVELSESEWRRWLQWGDPFGGKPGRFMFRSFCRDRAKILEVRVQHVQEISVEDVYAEGLNLEHEPYATWFAEAENLNSAGLSCGCRCPEIYPFARLWDSINASRGYSWESNPVVVALTLEKHCYRSSRDHNA